MGKQIRPSQLDVDMLANHDWRRTIAVGVDLAKDMIRSDVEMSERHVMWALLCHAAKVSQIAYPAPPRLGFPAKSAMPDAPDDVTQWQLIAAYLKGEVEEMPVDQSRPPMPSAEEISRADVVLHVWHRCALGDRGAKAKRAVYLKACGVPDRKVRAVTGLKKERIRYLKDCAAQEMWEAVKVY